MFMFWFYTLYTIALLHDMHFGNGVTAIMSVYAIFSDLLLYSLASQWAKKARPNVTGPFIRRIKDNPNIDPGIYKDTDTYNRLKKDFEQATKDLNESLKQK